MIHCPTCRNPLDASTTLIEGVTVHWCKLCHKMAAEVPGVAMEWIYAMPGVVERLKSIVHDSRTVLAIRDSDDDDPRWGVMG